MFADQGLQLVRSEVADSGESFHDGTGQAGDADDPGGHSGNGDDALELAVPLRPPQLGMDGARLLDVMV